MQDRYLPPGVRVRYDGRQDGSAEFGIVVHCWHDAQIDGYDCYVAFFGESLPDGKPDQKPYILRYAATSLLLLEG